MTNKESFNKNDGVLINYHRHVKIIFGVEESSAFRKRLVVNTDYNCLPLYLCLASCTAKIERGDLATILNEKTTHAVLFCFWWIGSLSPSLLMGVLYWCSDDKLFITFHNVVCMN